ncbi:single-stranded DNA-binding protein [Jiangella muralis]|uniref:single-stranded DNA-binding protein n=1 Tax=Jiangella muralis TaxID=702383 RepID=UPI001969D632|nr:single-stranded DNA-binding protein [Jiangella muralis]
MGNSFPMSATGRVVRIPEQVTTRSGAPMAKFTIAVHDFARQPDGSWLPRQVVNHDVVAFGATAQAVAGLGLEAGDPVIVVGDLVFNAYQARDGVRVSCEIRARAVALDGSADGVTISRSASRPVEHAGGTTGVVPSAPASSASSAATSGEGFSPAPVPPPPPSIPETPAAHQPVPQWPDPAAEASGVGR